MCKEDAQCFGHSLLYICNTYNCSEYADAYNDHLESWLDYPNDHRNKNLSACSNYHQCGCSYDLRTLFLLVQCCYATSSLRNHWRGLKDKRNNELGNWQPNIHRNSCGILLFEGCVYIQHHVFQCNFWHHTDSNNVYLFPQSKAPQNEFV